MVCRYPFLDELVKRLGFGNNFFGFGLSGHQRMVIVNDVSFAPRGLKEVERTIR